MKYVTQHVLVGMCVDQCLQFLVLSHMWLTVMSHAAYMLCSSIIECEHKLQMLPILQQLVVVRCLLWSCGAAC